MRSLPPLALFMRVGRARAVVVAVACVCLCVYNLVLPAVVWNLLRHLVGIYLFLLPRLALLFSVSGTGADTLTTEKSFTAMTLWLRMAC